MRSNSLPALQASLRLSLLIFSLGVLSLHVSIIILEQVYPKVDPEFPKRENYICFPQENDEFGAMYMNVLRVIDIICSVMLIGVCVALEIHPSTVKLHWPISVFSGIRFIVVLFEIVHVSSVNGDTQLDIILSVNEGICKVSDDQRPVFKALIAIFVLRCVKGFITILMGSLAYGHSIVMVLFGTDEDDQEDNGTTFEEHEMEELEATV